MIIDGTFGIGLLTIPRPTNEQTYLWILPENDQRRLELALTT